MSTCVNWVKKVPRSAVDENFNFFDFSKNFQNEENHHIFTPGQLKYKNSLIWMENVHMCELSQKGPQLRSGRKRQPFFIFQNVFENEENCHIFTPGQLKYKNSLIWIENVHRC